MQQPPPEIAAVPPHSAAASRTMALPPTRIDFDRRGYARAAAANDDHIGLQT